jgi:hypothetical protein
VFNALLESGALWKIFLNAFQCFDVIRLGVLAIALAAIWLFHEGDLELREIDRRQFHLVGSVV